MFVREITLSAFDAIDNYYDIMESQINTIKQDDMKNIEQILSDLKLDEEEVFAESGVLMQEHEARFAMQFPNFFRFSYIVLLYITIEYKLHELCIEAIKRRGISLSIKKPPGDVINTYRGHLETAGINDLEWDFIYELSKVRNCLVHNSGNVSSSRQENKEYLRNLVGKAPGFFISKNTWEDRDDLQPLYLEKDMIMLESDYCKYATANVRSFFEKLCDAIPIQPFLRR